MLPSLTIVVSVFPLCDVYALYARIHAMHAWTVCPGPKCPDVPAENLLGCFVGHGKGGVCDLPVVKTGHCPNASLPWLVGMSAEVCNALCAGYTYFGLQDGGMGCFCGSTYGRCAGVLVVRGWGSSETCGILGARPIPRCTMGSWRHCISWHSDGMPS